MKIAYKKKDYEIPDAHPASNCLPWHLDTKEFSELIYSVKCGFDSDKPIIVQSESQLIISGRRRSLACVIAGVYPVTREVEWTDQQVLDWVKRDELIRRNLTPSERAAALIQLARLNEHGANQHKSKGKEEGSADPSSTKTVSEIAEETGVGRETVKRIAYVKKNAPELMSLITEGKLEANLAARCAKELTTERRRKIVNADDPKSKAKEFLVAVKPVEPKPSPAAPKEDSPTRGGNNFDYGKNAKAPEPAEADEPDPMTDPDAFVKAMETVCYDIDNFIKGIRHLEKSKYSVTVMLPTAISQIEAARKQLWINRPSHKCSYCDGRDKNCRACKGTGRLSKAAHDRGKAANGEAA